VAVPSIRAAARVGRKSGGMAGPSVVPGLTFWENCSRIVVLTAITPRYDGLTWGIVGCVLRQHRAGDRTVPDKRHQAGESFCRP